MHRLIRVYMVLIILYSFTGMEDGTIMIGLECLGLGYLLSEIDKARHYGITKLLWR